MLNLKENFHHLKSWPFEEAKKILSRVQNSKLNKEYVLLETGYGPSGLPHIGTFGEVARTSMVRYAFSQISNIPTRLFVFSDDMDGLRKVPDNVPNKEMLSKNLYKPLTQIPDPFEKYESFGHHNNAMLKRFLDSFGFDYEFKSSSNCYSSGYFDSTLISVLQHYEEIMSVILPTLRNERRATYSPFLPICPTTGHVLQVPMEEVNPHNNSVIYKNPETGKLVETLVTGGHCKLQWKVDWGMRWANFNVDYEMSGKDLIDSVKLSSKVCKILGSEPPVNLTYELFLNENGEKISKSKGNGLTIDEWLTYAPCESLAYYMYQSPKRAKRLYFDIIPKAVDEYLNYKEKYFHQPPIEQSDNPVFHVHHGHIPPSETGLSFNILLNLASVCNAENENVLWGFVQKYTPDVSPKNTPFLNNLIKYAIRYYHNFVKPNKQYRQPTSLEKDALKDLIKHLNVLSKNAKSEDIQFCVYEIGKSYFPHDLKFWFKAIYEVLLGQKEGPRMGSFIALYGIKNTQQLIHERLQS